MHPLGKRIRIKKGWGDAGRQGKRIGPYVVINSIQWVPVVWDDEEDPDWHKSRGLEDATE